MKYLRLVTTMSAIAIPRRSVHFLVFLALLSISLILIASHNIYRMESSQFNGFPAAGENANVMGYGFGCDEIPMWQSQLIHRASMPPIAGVRDRGAKRLFTIGIASVYREEKYLSQTLQSLINESDADERKDAVVVIYLADTDPEKKEKQLLAIRKQFQVHLDSGFFQVIESGPEIYPPMDFALTKRTFNDSTERVLWRTKQVIDFAFLFTYAKSLSTYYLVIEDDIISSSQYITAVKDFIKSRKESRWVALHFSGFLGIGLLFHNSDLPNLIRLLLMFHQDQPVDMLMRQFISLQIPDEVLVRRIPSIFQHIGWKSTLPNKLQKLQDNTFDMAKRRYKNHNPPADLLTTMKVFNDFGPEYAYRSAPGFFWGIPKPGDTFDIIFPHPISISRVVILTGAPNGNKNQPAMKDVLADGKLEASSSFQKVAQTNRAICDNFTVIGEFRKSGDVDLVWKGGKGGDIKEISSSPLPLSLGRSSNVSSSPSASKTVVKPVSVTPVQCLRVKVGPSQKTWIIFREIQVFTT